jgi:Mn-dependent DtxR family transcriptional regulator
VLRDIKAKRLKLSPVSTVDLNILTELGLIEMRDDVPVLTNAGHAAID